MNLQYISDNKGKTTGVFVPIMKYESFILLAAKEDLQTASKWYNQIRSGLGKELVVRFRVRLLQTQKEYPKKPDNKLLQLRLGKCTFTKK